MEQRKPLNGSAFGLPAGVTLSQPVDAATAEILSVEALSFVAALARRFEPRRLALLAARQQRAMALEEGGSLDFLPETSHIREGKWKVAPIPADLQDRRVEITGPVDRKMIINALNSGANVFMADFEDASSPLWRNMVEGQLNLRDAVRRTLRFTSPEGKDYVLNDSIATLIVRPRGWHLEERHLKLDDLPVAGAFMDFGLFLFHNARELLARGSGPYFYLPKTEHYSETALWADMFHFAEEALDIAYGSIKATVLIETIHAAFQMDEIIYSLRDYMAGLNCGRWDYIFSYIKAFHARADCVLPNRAEVTMTAPFMRAYSQLLIQTCHKRGCFAMGGMAAAIPVKNDAAKNDAAFAAVRKDKEREAGDGHDGTWVAHPALVPVAKEVFDRLMPGRNQLGKLREDVRVSATELQQAVSGSISEAGMRLNLRTAGHYIAAWLSGRGAVPINNLMEDAATAEISRAQCWQWLHHSVKLEDGREVTTALAEGWLKEEMAELAAEHGAEFEAGRLQQAGELLHQLVFTPQFTEFLTLPGYRLLG